MRGSSDGPGLALGLSSGLPLIYADLGGDRLTDLTEARLELHGLGLGEVSGVKPSERSDGVLSSSSLDCGR